MKRTSYSIPLLVVAVILSTAVIGAAQNREKFVISAKAGGVNAISGRAEVRSKRGGDWQLLNITDDLKSGDQVQTGSDGRIEMLLNPGSYLRVAENSEFELIDGSLVNLEVRLSKGTAIIEATGPENTEVLINVTTPHARIAIVRSGLYRVSVIPGGTTELIVRKGRVLLDNAQTKVKGGNKVVFTSSTYFVAKVQKLDKRQDNVETWSKQRAETLAQANRKIPAREANLFLANSFDVWGNGFSPNPGIWFFHPGFHCFTFLPFQFGWGSPYGGSYSGIWFYNGYHCCGWNPYRPVFASRTEEAPGWGIPRSGNTGGSSGSTGTGGSPGGRSGSPGPAVSPELPIGRGKPDTNPGGNSTPRLPN